jgi:hypothetical protein
MKGHYERRGDGQYADVPPCKTCRHKGELTVGPHCYSCIDTVAIASHRPNAETDFVNYEAAQAGEGEHG